MSRGESRMVSKRSWTGRRCVTRCPRATIPNPPGACAGMIRSSGSNGRFRIPSFRLAIDPFGHSIEVMRVVDNDPMRSPTAPDPIRRSRSDPEPPSRVEVPLFKPLIEQEEISAATEALEMGWLGMGSYVHEFEQALVELVGAPEKHVAAVSTGHAALHLALLVAGVGVGDEVITPSFNNVADFQAILA